MRLKKIILVTLALLTGGAMASAQDYGGWLTDLSRVSPADMISLSQWDYSLGSARSAAMGGAISALGADISAIGINPAGLGTYRRNQVGVSLGLGFSSMSNNLTNNYETQTNPQVNSMGGVAILDARVNGLLVSNLAFVYNKIADMNFSTSASFGSGKHSILDLFALQLNGLLPYVYNNDWAGIRLDALNGKPFDNTNISPDEWGAVLAYQLGMVVPSSNAGSNVLYGVGGLSAGANIFSSFDYYSTGYVGQYDMAWGGNINNVIYLGVSFGFQDIWQQQSFIYDEEYRGNNISNPNIALRGLNYVQESRISGMGFNAKLGVIIRPTPSFRVGISYHTPTAVALKKEYETNMTARFFSGRRTQLFSDGFAFFEESYYSPSRLTIGLAYTYLNKWAFSVDFESVNYGNINVAGEAPIKFIPVSEEMTSTLNVRLGVEYKATDRLALRAGYAGYGAYSSNAFDLDYYYVRHSPHEFNNALKYSGGNYSLGIGYTWGRSRWDLAYVFSRNIYTSVDVYYYDGEALQYDGTMGRYTYGNDGDPLAPAAPMEDISVARNNFILSYSYSF